MNSVETWGNRGLPHFERHGEDVVLVVDGRPFTMLAGEVRNSSSSSSRVFDEAAAAAAALGMNTVLAPVSWELIEPEEGVYDFSSLDAMLEIARTHDLRLGLLWFGAWKNAQGYYAPGWVKRDLGRFPRAQMERGKNKMVLTDFHGMSYTAFSLYEGETLECDARAFAAVMRHLAEVDAERQTVLVVQVENECGEQGSAREHSDAADRLFAERVPDGLLRLMREHAEGLAQDVARALELGAGEGTWQEVFGEVAEELFTSYHMASYVETVARAGKREYALPMVANCWLDKGHKPGRFPTGGPVARVMEIWRYAAPTIEAYCPDIYVPCFCRVCDEYRKLGNPLYIPETAIQAFVAARQLWAVGHHHAICFAPFGFEEMGQPFDASVGVLFGADVSDPRLRIPQDPEEYGAVTRALADLLSLLPTISERQTLDAVIAELPDHATMIIGGYRVRVVFPEGGTPGACVCGRAADGSMYLLGMHCMLAFESTDASRPHVDIIALEDGAVSEGRWERNRRLNGDEAAVIRLEGPTLLRVELFAYA